MLAVNYNSVVDVVPEVGAMCKIAKLNGTKGIKELLSCERGNTEFFTNGQSLGLGDTKMAILVRSETPTFRESHKVAGGVVGRIEAEGDDEGVEETGVIGHRHDG